MQTSIENESPNTEGAQSGIYSKNRTTILLSMAAVAVVGIWWYRVRLTSPERIMETPWPASILGVHDGKIYVTSESAIGEVTSNKNSKMVWTIDPENPSVKKPFWDFGKEAAGTETGFSTVTPIIMDSTGLRCSVMRTPSTPVTPRLVAASGSFVPATTGSPMWGGLPATNGGAMGMGMMMGGSGGPGLKPAAQVRSVNVTVSLKELGQAVPTPHAPSNFDLIVKDFDSNPPRTLIPGLPGGSSASVKGKAYWIQQYTWSKVPKRFTNHVDGNVRYYYTLPLCDRLMVSDSGKSEFTGLNLGPTELRAGKDGIYWMEGETKQRQLCYLPLDSKVPVKLQNYAGMGFPEECNDKVYWLEIPPRPIGDTTSEPPDRVEIKCATVGLGSVQSVMIVNVGNPPPDLASVASKLCVNNGHLYLISPDWARAEKLTISDTPARHVYEVIVGDHPTLRLCCNLPIQSTFAQIDNGYCYYYVREQKESWWDWSQKGLIPQQVSALFRRPLQQ